MMDFCRIQELEAQSIIDIGVQFGSLLLGDFDQVTQKRFRETINKPWTISGIEIEWFFSH